MRSRLLGIVAILVALMVLGLGFPLAISVADYEQQRVFVDRLANASHLASDAQRALLSEQTDLLTPQFQRFEQVYGQDSALFDSQRRLVASSPTHVDLHDSQVAAAVGNAFVGRLPTTDELLAPWAEQPLIMAQPVLIDGEMRGVVVTSTSTHNARMRVLRLWLLIAGGAVVVFAIGLGIALPLARWFLRPVRMMDEATDAMTQAVLDGRPVPDAPTQNGPPELRRLSCSVHEMAKRVADALDAQRAFVADASHQLRNPLTALRLQLSNLRDDVPASVAGQADSAAEEARRFGEILDDLLAMATAESQEALPKPVDLGCAVESRLNSWRSAAENRDVRLRQKGESRVKAWVNPAGLDAVLDALLDNAVKFTAPGSDILVTTRNHEDGVLLKVRDHGPGLPPQELQRATDRFWRSPRDQNVQGTGLGLAIVERIVSRCDGSLVLENAIDGGGGLVVRVLLPAFKAARNDNS